MRNIIIGKIYIHFKGKKYIVTDIVNDSSSEDKNNPKKIVIYKALYGDYLTWAREYEEFVSEVDHIKYPDVKQKYRFEEFNLE